LAVTVNGAIAIGKNTKTTKRIILPQRLTRGLPYVLVPSGDAYGALMAVPFHMGPFRNEVLTSRLGTFIKEQLIAEADSLNLNVHANRVAFSKALQKVFNNRFNVKLEDGKIVISTLNDKNEKTAVYTTSSTSVDEAFIDKMLKNLAKKQSVGIRVNLNSINLNVGLEGQSVSYNELIGEFAMSNLAVPHTVNDWFTIAPVDS